MQRARSVAVCALLLGCQTSLSVEQPLATDAGLDAGIALDAGGDAGVSPDAGADGGSDGGPIDAGYCPGTPCVCNGYDLCNWNGAYECEVDDDWTHTVVPPDAPPDSQYLTLCPSPPSRLNMTNNCYVTDQVTGLIWQQTASSDGFNQAEAQVHCAGLNYGGFSSGWRLPSVVELTSIVIFGARPSLNHSAFPNAEAAGFWTSTVSQVGGWVVEFGDGAVTAISSTERNRVRCVR